MHYSIVLSPNKLIVEQPLRVIGRELEPTGSLAIIHASDFTWKKTMEEKETN